MMLKWTERQVTVLSPELHNVYIKHPTCTVVSRRTCQLQWFLCHSYWELLAVFILNTEKCIIRSNRTSSGQHSTSSAP